MTPIQSRQLAYQTALNESSDDALERFFATGKQLTFVDDKVSPWGPGWLYDEGLIYNEVCLIICFMSD